MTLLLHPQEDGPVYVARKREDGGYFMVPYFAEPERGRDMTESEFKTFAELTRLSGGVVGGGRA